MKPRLVVFCAALVAFTGAATAAPLDGKSLAPDWAKATQAEKDAWLAAFQFKQADVDKAEVATCMDQYSSKPVFQTNALSGVTEMCGSIAALPN